MINCLVDNYCKTNDTSAPWILQRPEKVYRVRHNNSVFFFFSRCCGTFIHRHIHRCNGQYYSAAIGKLWQTDGLIHAQIDYFRRYCYFYTQFSKYFANLKLESQWIGIQDLFKFSIYRMLLIYRWNKKFQNEMRKNKI